MLLELRSGLVNHTAVSRVVSMIGYRLKCKLNEFVMTCAYLAFEACSGHDYGFTCNRCEFYPKCLIYDLTKKAVFEKQLMQKSSGEIYGLKLLVVVQRGAEQSK